jgi:hypothetical protein
MAQRKRPRPNNGATKTSELIRLAVSSGHALLIRRPSVGLARAIMTKAAELYPYPDPPKQTITTLVGDVDVIKEDDEAYLAKCKAADGEREGHLLEWAFEHRLEVEGYEAEDGHAALIADHADDLAELREFGSVPEDMRELDEYQLVLRMFVVADMTDYTALYLSVHKAFDAADIEESEIRQRSRFL